MGHSRGPAHRCPNPIAARLTEQATPQSQSCCSRLSPAYLPCAENPPAADDRFLARHAADPTIASATRERSATPGELTIVFVAERSSGAGHRRDPDVAIALAGRVFVSDAKAIAG